MCYILEYALYVMKEDDSYLDTNVFYSILPKCWIALSTLAWKIDVILGTIQIYACV